MQTTVKDLHITDHSMIVLSIAIIDYSNESNSQAYYRLDYDKLKSNLDSLDWSPVYLHLSASEAFDQFHDMLTKEILNSSKECFQKSCSRKLKPWMTSLICNKIKFRKTLYTRMKNNPDDNRSKVQ